ncbi:MAG: hypothetical protein AB7S75_24230 [Desulfococcaceae bacterium]
MDYPIRLKRFFTMNMQKRSDERSKVLHREIARKLRNRPELWAVPKNNIRRWKEERKSIMPSIMEWEHILNEYSRERILNVLESDSEESIRLRSSSPFTGILNDRERKMIFESFSKNAGNSECKNI